MRFIYDNIAAIYVAIVASLMGWLYGGTRADVLLEIVPWLMLFMIQIMLIFPQKHEGETTYDARERVWRAMKKDPLVWLAFGFILLLAIPFANNGLCPRCDRALIAQGVSSAPPVKIIPFCVNRMHHLNVFLWFFAALSAMVVTKHGLTRSGKRLALEMIVWNGFALAVLGFVQAASGAEGPFWQKLPSVLPGYPTGPFFSTFGYPNMAGDYFAVLFGLSLAIWRDRYSEVAALQKTLLSEKVQVPHRLFWQRHLYLIPAGVCAFAAISTLSRAAIMITGGIALVAFLHSVVELPHGLHKKDRIRQQMLSVLIMVLVTFFAVISMPDDVQTEVDSVDTTETLMRLTGKGQSQTRVAMALWRDNILFGCGGWGFKHLAISKMKPSEVKEPPMVGGINVHNDYLQFLTEHGLVGFGALVAMVLMLVMPVFAVWSKLVKAARFMDAKKAPPRPVHIFALPAPAFFILMTALATFIHGFCDCPFRSPAVMTLFFVSLAAVPGFLPRETTNAAR